MILIEELIKRGILKEKDALNVVRVADEKYNGKVDEALVDLKFDEDKILEAKGEIFGIPIKKIKPADVPTSVLKMIPLEAARMYQFISINLTDNFLEVGIIDPENIQAIDALTFITAKLNKVTRAL